MSHNNNKNPRQVVRQRCRARRNALSVSEQQEASTRALNQCIEKQLLVRGDHVAFYLAADGELDPYPMIKHCWESGIKTYLPVLHPFSAGNLLFIHYHSNSVMKANKYGIAEPVLACPDVCPLQNLTTIFTPLVAFDRGGNRMGMGGGYYDRTLAPIRREGWSTRLIGLAHSCQEVDALPFEPWDIPLSAIVTPDTLLSI